MRTITVAAIIALLTMPAYAQSKGMGATPGFGEPKETEADKKQKILDEKAYKDSLARIPSRQKVDDPWARMR
jgi:hypothetical protein